MTLINYDIFMTQKLISWNVNGIRSVLQKGFEDFVKKENPDILCLQEVKAMREQAPEVLLPDYQCFWNAAHKKGYSGTAIFTKIKPVQSIINLDHELHQTEGRVITLEFPKFYLVNVYTPNIQSGPHRLEYRIRWDKDFFDTMVELEKKKPVIFCGDLNVAHEEIDLARPKENIGNPGFTDEERDGFRRYVKHGFIDSYRHLHKEGGTYTWWTYRFQARQRNIGWRIDYFCLSKSLEKNLKEAFIHDKVMGSDHCPVGIIIDV